MKFACYQIEKKKKKVVFKLAGFFVEMQADDTCDQACVFSESNL